MSSSFPSYFSSSPSNNGYDSNSSSSSSGPSSSYFSRFTSSFGSSSDVSGSKDFLESNTLIAKTAFLLLVIILFFILSHNLGLAFVDTFPVLPELLLDTFDLLLDFILLFKNKIIKFSIQLYQL